MNQAVVFEKAKFWRDQDILFITFHNRDICHTMPLAAMERYVDTIHALCENKPTPFLIDVTDAIGSYSIAAAKYFAKCKKLEKIRVAEAFVANRIGSKLTIRSFKRIYDSKTPYKICSTREEALEYCKQFVK
ncbi:hypothetical protein [Gilvibacter sp.]|uniref:DUF7793 family protein n=1 Tax=Gilvibacter sp. TaxID=2729997 RepID=UPI0035BE45E2